MYTDQEIMNKLGEILQVCLPEVPLETLTPDTVINRDLGVDSMNFVMIMVKVESAFDIRTNDDDWTNLSTVQDVVDLIKQYLAAKENA